MTKIENITEPVVFFDFDNTITTFDVLDDMLTKFSRDDNWIKLEEDWKGEKIGSGECLKGQVEGMGMTKEALDEYLSGVKIDPYFGKIVELLKAKNIKTFILSDNFDYILKRILDDNGLRDLRIYSNSLKIDGDHLITGFLFSDKTCGDCAHCKRTSLLKNIDNNSTSIYVGDGRSDVCVSEVADIVFAKGYLKGYCENNGISHIPFEGLKEVYGHFQNLPAGRRGI
jgi:2,3-diketo-5-methylthio-1-phosphopentane phosphatase